MLELVLVLVHRELLILWVLASMEIQSFFLLISLKCCVCVRFLQQVFLYNPNFLTLIFLPGKIYCVVEWNYIFRYDNIKTAQISVVCFGDKNDSSLVLPEKNNILIETKITYCHWNATYSSATCTCRWRLFRGLLTDQCINYIYLYGTCI